MFETIAVSGLECALDVKLVSELPVQGREVHGTSTLQSWLIVRYLLLNKLNVRMMDKGLAMFSLV